MAFHNTDCQIIIWLSHISTFQMLVIIVHRTFWWISLLLFLIQVSKRKSSPCSLYVDCRRKRYCRQKIAFGKGPHQLWCCTCNSLHQNMWWCEEPHMVTGKNYLFFFLYEDRLKWEPTILPKSTIWTLIQEKKRDHSILGLKSSSWLETNTNMCQWLMRKMCSEAFLSWNGLSVDNCGVYVCV